MDYNGLKSNIFPSKTDFLRFTPPVASPENVHPPIWGGEKFAGGVKKNFALRAEFNLEFTPPPPGFAPPVSPPHMGG